MAEAVSSQRVIVGVQVQPQASLHGIFWCTTWQYDRFVYQYFCFPLSVSFHHS